MSRDTPRPHSHDSATSQHKHASHAHRHRTRAQVGSSLLTHAAALRLAWLAIPIALLWLMFVWALQ